MAYPSPANVPQLTQTGQPPQTPQLYLDNQLDTVRRSISEREQQLVQAYREKKIDANGYNQNVTQLQAEMDETYKRHQQTVTTIQQIQQMEGLGLIDADRVNEAVWSVILPPEARRVLFEQESQEDMEGPLTPNQLDDYYESVGNVAQNRGETEVVKGKVPWKVRALQAHPVTSFAGAILARRHGRVKRRTKKGLVSDYMTWRANIGYDSFTPQKKVQLDLQWDQWMDDQQYPAYAAKGKEISKGTKEFSGWNPDDPDVKALRPQGRLAAAYNGGSPVDNTPRYVGDRQNPIQSSIAKELPKPKVAGKKLTDEVRVAFLRKAGKDKNKAKELARAEGYEI